MAAAAFFDLDRTVLSRSSALALAGAFRARGLISPRQLAHAAARQAHFTALGADEGRGERLIAEGVSVLPGLRPEEMREIVHGAYDSALKPLVYPEALALAGAHRSAGDAIYLVSAVLFEVVDQVAVELGFDGALGTVCEVEDGVYTGRPLSIYHGEGKAAAVRELASSAGIDLAASTGYSDSSSDIPFLELVGRAVAVNPDRRLRATAEWRGWEIRQFHRRPERGRGLSPLAYALSLALGTGVAIWALRRGES